MVAATTLAILKGSVTNLGHEPETSLNLSEEIIALMLANGRASYELGELRTQKLFGGSRREGFRAIAYKPTVAGATVL